MQRLQYGRRHGYVAKLVFEPQAANWDGSPAVVDLENQTRVRFVNGKVFGTGITPFHVMRIDPETGNPIMEGGRTEMKTLDGRYVEIHSTVSDEGLDFDEGVARAKANCLATMGLLALVCGEQVFGPLVLEDYVHVRDDAEYGRDRIPSFLSQPRSVDDAQLDAIDRALTFAARTDPKETPFRHGIHLALRWYVDAASTSSPFTCFTASFLALEALATSFVAEHRVDTREELTRFNELVAAAGKKGITANKAMVATVKTVLGDLPLARKFELFRRDLNGKLGSHKDDVVLFNDARSVRNHVMHGRLTDVPWDKATPLKGLLERATGAVLGVPLPPPKSRVFHTDVDWGAGVMGLIRHSQYGGGSSPGTCSRGSKPRPPQE